MYNICKNFPCKPTCPNALDPPVMAVCRQRGNKLRYDYTYFRDKYDNIFCSRECAEVYYDIQEYDWAKSDGKHTYQKTPVLWGDLTYDNYQAKYEIVEECDNGNYQTRRARVASS